MQKCNVCNEILHSPIYTSGGNFSITSLQELIPRKTRIYFSKQCGHLQAEPFENLAVYYNEGYKFLANSEDEDQLYQVSGGKNVFRFDHQAATLLKKLVIPRDARILDFGCSKVNTLKRIVSERPDVSPHLFDITDRYIPFWEKFVAKDQWAVFKPPKIWHNYFDLLTSFFVLEHVGNLKEVLATVRSLLKSEGTFYGIVPNVYTNRADFLVADHVNHFSPASLSYFLSNGGFSVEAIDDNAHESALVFIAKKKDAVDYRQDDASLQETDREAREVAGYWNTAADKIKKLGKDSGGDKKAAIYGAGFYGAFIASHLRDPDSITCFVDRNPYRQGQTFFGKKIITPEALPNNIRTIYVGLNPRIARDEIAKVKSWQKRKLKYSYL